jgi:hypothetical protein
LTRDNKFGELTRYSDSSEFSSNPENQVMGETASSHLHKKALELKDLKDFFHKPDEVEWPEMCDL